VGAKVDEEVAHVGASATSLVGDLERRLLAGDQSLEQRLVAAQQANDLMLEQRMIASSRADDQTLEARVVGSFSTMANQLTSTVHGAQAALEQRLALPRGTATGATAAPTCATASSSAPEWRPRGRRAPRTSTSTSYPR
jgi:hypothetical protein